MKTTLFLLSLICTTAAFAQMGGASLSSPVLASPFSITSHGSHAAPQQMAEEQSLLGSSQVYIAHGERPLWEVAPPDPPLIPLGDIARMLKKEHATAKKAQFVYEQYGPAAN